MKRSRRLILWLGLVALGGWLWSVVFPGPEKAIRQHLTKTARAASFQANAGPMDQLSNIAGFAKCFSPDAEVKFESPGGGTQALSGRDDLMRAAGVARGLGTALQVEFLDAFLTVASDQQTATVDLIVRAAVPGDRDFFVQEMKVYLKKFGRAWLIVRAETVKTLSRTDAPQGSRKPGVEVGVGLTQRGSAAKPQAKERDRSLVAAGEPQKTRRKIRTSPRWRSAAGGGPPALRENFRRTRRFSGIARGGCGEAQRFADKAVFTLSCFSPVSSLRLSAASASLRLIPAPVSPEVAGSSFTS